MTHAAAPAPSDTSSIRASMMPRRPAGVGKIEKARDARHALVRLVPYLRPFWVTLAFVFGLVVLGHVFRVTSALPYLAGLVALVGGVIAIVQAFRMRSA